MKGELKSGHISPAGGSEIARWRSFGVKAEIL